MYQIPSRQATPMTPGRNIASFDANRSLAEITQSMANLATALRAEGQNQAAFQSQQSIIDELDKTTRSLKMERALFKEELALSHQKRKDLADRNAKLKTELKVARAAAPGFADTVKALQKKVAELEAEQKAAAKVKLELGNRVATLRKEKEALSSQAADAASRRTQSFSAMKVFGDRIKELETENARLRKEQEEVTGDLEVKMEAISELETLVEDMAARIDELESEE